MMNFNIEIPPSTIGGWISLGIYGFALISILFGFIAGLRRGFTKTIVRIATIVLAGFAAYFAASWLIGAFDAMFAGKTLEEVIISVYTEYETAVDPQTREIIAAFDIETAQLILGGVTALVLSPIVFILSFLLARLVLLLVDWLICAILRKSNKDKGAPSTIFGGLLGIIQGAVIALIILIPISGMLSLANGVKGEMLAKESVTDEGKKGIEAFYAQYLDEPMANPLVSVINTYGGNEIYHALSKTKVGETTYDMTERASTIAYITMDVTSLKGMNWQSPDETQKATIERIVTDMCNDEYTARVLAGVLRGSATALTDNIEIFGLEAPYDELFKEAFGIFKTSDEYNLEGDLDTMLHVYFTMADNDILVLIAEQNVDGIKDKLTTKVNDELIVDNLIGTLQANDRTAHLVTLFTKLSVSIMADQLGLDEDTVQLYEDLKGDLTGVLELNRDSFETEEEYKAEVETQLTDALEKNGIVLEDEIIDGMTDYVAENFAGEVEITDQAINDAILSYYSAYVDYLNNGGEMPEIPEIPGVTVPGTEGAE